MTIAARRLDDPRRETGNVPAWLSDGSFDAALRDIALRAAEHDRDASFPTEAFALLQRFGLASLTAPGRYGGLAANLGLCRRVLGRIAAADPSVALVFLWQFVCVAEITRPESDWPEEARVTVLRSVQDTNAFINTVNVEPELGSPARGGLPATRARRLADGSWRLNGRKTYATGLPLLRWALVSATIDAEGDPRMGIFLVDAQGAHVRSEETWDHMGLRASGSHDLILDGAIVPAGFLVSKEVPGARMAYGDWRQAWTCVLLGALYDGVARAARDWLVTYLNQRVPANLGKPLATLPRFQTGVGQIELLLEANARLLGDVARAIDTGDAEERQAAFAFAPLLKHLVTTNAISVTGAALELTGNPGHSRRNPLERHHRDALAGRIHTPQADSALQAAGQSLLARAAGFA
jgi:alkylation response protein AidB-like acyl-CoA dehydrogenase